MMHNSSSINLYTVIRGVNADKNNKIDIKCLRHLIPPHVSPFPVNPVLHVHVKDPRVLSHIAFESQGLLRHSFTSEI